MDGGTMRALVLLFSFCVFCFSPKILLADDTQQAVLVTGASSGIGRKITETLAAKGHFVYAGARKQKDMDALNALDNVQAVRLDVTVQEDIDNAVKLVRDGGKGLYGIVNNAGIYIGGPIIETPVEELNWVMDVNVAGVYRVTQAFAPLVIESKGRITTIGSISGVLAGRFGGHYSMSKHAIEAFTDSLAAEMENLDVMVSVIEPGNYNSKIADTALKRMLTKAENYQYFKEEMEDWLNRDWDRGKYKDPEEVAEAALHALFSDDPKRRYMVVPNEREASITIDQIIKELVQLNEYQAYSYSRDELVERLDAALGEKKNTDGD